MEKYRKTDLFSLELGIDLCSEEWIYELVKSIQSLRKEFFERYGVVIPKVHVKDDIKLNPLEYVIKVNSYEAGRFEFQTNSILIVDTGSVKKEIQGKPGVEPAFGAPALWIEKCKKREAEKNGYLLLTSQKIIMNHLKEKIRENLSSVITSQYVGELLDEILKDNNFLCIQLVKKYGVVIITLVKLVLSSLLDEGIKISNILLILDVIANEPKYDRVKIPELINKVRCAIIPDVIESLDDVNNGIMVLMFSQKLSEHLFDHITENGDLVLEPVIRKWFENELISKLGKISDQDFTPVILCVEPLRHSVQKYLDFIGMKNVHVVSDMEMSIAIRKMNISLHVFGTIEENIEVTSEHTSEAGTSKSQKISNEDFIKLQKNLNQILESLEPLEQKVMSMRFGLREEGSHTLEEVGNYFNLTRNEIRKIEAKALRLLRKNNE